MPKTKSLMHKYIVIWSATTLSQITKILRKFDEDYFFWNCFCVLAASCQLFFFSILVFFCRILMMYRTEEEDGGHSEFISVTSFRIKNTNILNATESPCLNKASGRAQRGNLWFQTVIRWSLFFTDVYIYRYTDNQSNR